MNEILCLCLFSANLCKTLDNFQPCCIYKCNLRVNLSDFIHILIHSTATKEIFCRIFDTKSNKHQKNSKFAT